MAAAVLKRNLFWVCLLALSCAWAPGCDEQTAVGVEPVKLDGRWFHLELAADPATRVKGLGGRDFIAEDGGMLFVFPKAEPLQFVMRDCLVDIDIIFVDASGRVTAAHAMEAEEIPQPRGEDESASAYNQRRARYESSLQRYSSRYAAQFVIELAGGTLEGLDIEAGQKLDLDLARLKSLAD